MPEIWGEVDYDDWDVIIFIVGGESLESASKKFLQDINTPMKCEIGVVESVAEGMNLISDDEDKWVCFISSEVSAPSNVIFDLRENGLDVTSALIKDEADGTSSGVYWESDSGDMHKIEGYDKGQVIATSMLDPSCFVTHAGVVSDITPIDESISWRELSDKIKRQSYGMYVDTGVEVVKSGGDS